MRKTKQQLEKHRGDQVIEFNKLMAYLSLNRKETRELKVVLKDYQRESGRIRIEIKKILNEFRNVLKRREYLILCWRFRRVPITLTEIGKIFKVSRERIRQIESRGLDRIRGLIGF